MTELQSDHQRETKPRPPGVCIAWADKLKELPPITGDADLVKRQWESLDELAYTYIWHVLVSF